MISLKWICCHCDILCARCRGVTLKPRSLICMRPSVARSWPPTKNSSQMWRSSTMAIAFYKSLCFLRAGSQLERHTASYMTTETIQSPYASLGNKYPRIKGNTLFVFHRATYACRSDKNRMNPVVWVLPHLQFGFHPDGLYTPFYLLVCWGNYAALCLELVLANVYT